jgi:hypothetical protein
MFAWCLMRSPRSRGPLARTASADFFNQRWLDYTGLSAERARDWGWTVALHRDDLSGLTDYWHSILASGESQREEDSPYSS